MAGPEDAIPANLTPAGDLPTWTEGEFIAAVSAGIRPDGSQLDEGMPQYEMTIEDLASIYEYLQTIPAVSSE